MKRVCGLDVHKDTVFCATFSGKKTWPGGRIHNPDLLHSSDGEKV
jgi:hypothetical protein